MKIEEWKKELTERTGTILDRYKDMVTHINKLEDVDADFDEDEVTAFIVIKLTKMNKAIEKMSEFNG